MALLTDQLDPGYEVQEPVRRPDTPLDPPYRPSWMGEAPRPGIKPARQAEVKPYRPRPSEEMADWLTRKMTGAVGGMDAPSARRMAEGATFATELFAPPMWAAEGGYMAGKGVATGDAFDVTLGAGLGLLPVAGMLGKVPRALGEAAFTGPAAGSRQAQRGMFLLPQTPQELAAVRRAEQLEAEGKSAKDIWADTGLFRWVDDKWRTEISDKGAKFTGVEAFNRAQTAQAERIRAADDAISLKDLMAQRVDDPVATFKEITGRTPHPEALDMAARYSEQALGARLRSAEAAARAGVRRLPFTAVLEHPELYARRPELEKVETSFVSPKRLEGGEAQYVPGRPGAIEYDLKYGRAPDAEAVPTSLHEAQHASDYGFKLDYGANPTEIKAAAARDGITLTDAEAYDIYQQNAGETLARLTERRWQLTPQERRAQFPMAEGTPYGLDVPASSVMTREQMLGGPAAPPPVPTPSLSVGMGGRERGAVQFGMGGEQRAGRPLSDVLAEQPTTLRTLENLPQRQAAIAIDTIRQQMRRPEVSKAEKDVLEAVLAGRESGAISAEELVRGVQERTGAFKLAPVDTDRFAEYGLERIGRDTRPWTGHYPDTENVRTTVHQSPTPTSADNHFNNPNYFGHTRAFESNGIPHVIEIQSDLVQKAGKELAPEERARITEALQSVQNQAKTLSETLRSEAFKSDAVSMSEKFENTLAAMAVENPDFKRLLGDDLSRSKWYRDKYQFNDNGIIGTVRRDPEVVVDDLIENLRDPKSNKTDAIVAIKNALSDFRDDLSMLGSEHSAKLAQKTEAAEQRPMFKNWERRLIREELTRAAAQYEDLPRKVEYFKHEIGKAPYLGVDASDPAIRDLQYKLEQAQQQMNRPPVVRFADADTVAKVEAWPREIEYIQDKIVKDENLLDRRLPGTFAGTMNDWHYTGRVRAVGDNVEVEIYPINSMGDAIGKPQWSGGLTSKVDRYTLSQLTREMGFADPGHQGIYDRYNKEVTNYLKSLGGKHITDDKGHGWWEVPVDPKKYRRTQIFGMGGGAVAAGGAAGYNTATQQED